MSSRLFWGRLRLTATTTRNCTCIWKSTRGQTSDLKIPLLHFCTKTCMVINQHSNDQRTYCRHRSARAWSCEYLPCRGQAAWPHLRLGSTLTFKRGLPDEKVKVNIGEKWKWRRASSSSNPQVVAQGRLLKRKRIDSSGGHQWVGRSFILLFHGNWFCCFGELSYFSFLNFDGKVVPASSRPLPLQLQIRPGKCFENILSLFGSNKSWTRAFFFKYIIYDKI